MSDDTSTVDNPAGLAFSINRDWLRLLNNVKAGRANRSEESNRDIMRRHNGGGYNDHLGGRMRRLQEAGLAELPASNVWKLTPLGERRRAETEAHYAAGRLGVTSA